MDADYRLQLDRGFECKGHFIYSFFTSQNDVSCQVKCAKNFGRRRESAECEGVDPIWTFKDGLGFEKVG